MTYRTTRCVGMIAMSCRERPFGGNGGGPEEEEDRDGWGLVGRDVRIAGVAVGDGAGAEALPSCVRGAGGALLRLQEGRVAPPRGMFVSERDSPETDDDADAG